jgi:hypothetical protein
MTAEAVPLAIIRSVGGMVFDATFEETHEAELVVTDNPVETGVNVSDHAFMNPIRLTISAGVSDTPMVDHNEMHLNDPFASDGSGRSQRGYELLLALQKKAEPFDVQTGLKLYHNMVCVSIRTMQDKDTAGVFIFTATLREIIIYSTATTTYTPKAAGKTVRQASKRVTSGEKQAKEVPPERKKDLLTKGKQIFAGAIKRLLE